MPSFSERHGYEAASSPIKYREDATDNLREMIVNLAERHGLRPSEIRSELCDLLFVAPDQGNWSDYPNVDSECRMLIGECAWHEVFDTIENLGAKIHKKDYGDGALLAFQKDVNRLLEKDGAGWRMDNGLILARGSEPFNNVTKEASAQLLRSGSPTAASEIHEAIKDISRRPKPDKTGAIHHAMGAVECLARTLSNDPKSTLGNIIKKGKSHGIRVPLDEATAKLWGYASERARHIREGMEPSFEEAELIVTISAAICVYLSRKMAT